MFIVGSTGRLFRKHEALISEAQGAYFGSTGRLFWKHEALISEARGVLGITEWPCARRSVGFEIRQQGI